MGAEGASARADSVLEHVRDHIMNSRLSIRRSGQTRACFLLLLLSLPGFLGLHGVAHADVFDRTHAMLSEALQSRSFNHSLDATLADGRLTTLSVSGRVKMYPPRRWAIRDELDRARARARAHRPSEYPARIGLDLGVW